MKYIKLLKIKKYIELIIRNCSDRIDQKDSLYYLRTEISPLIINDEKSDNNLLNLLTQILFIKDMKELIDYIKKNLNDYFEDSYIISQFNIKKIIHLEQLYDKYNEKNYNNDIISFDNYDVITLKDLCFKPYKTAEIWFLEFSKSKKYLALGFSNSNISLFTTTYKNDTININLFLTFSATDKSKKGEITSISFSYDEKNLLISLSTNVVKIFKVSNGEKIKEYTSLHNSLITSCIYLPNSSTKFLTGSIDKKVLLVDMNSDKIPFLDIGKFVRIKQLIYSEILNLIIVIPGSISDIMCYDFIKNKMSFKIEIKEEIVYSNISKADKGKFLLINISKNFPKILLYNLEKTKIEDKYFGHSQKNMIIKCAFAGNKDQYIISGSEDGNVYLWDRNIFGVAKYIFKGHFGIVNSVELGFDDCIFSGSDDGEMKIWIPKNEFGDRKEIIYKKNKENCFQEKKNNLEEEFFKIIYKKNKENCFQEKKNNFEEEFFKIMEEPLEEVPNEEENVEEESDEEEERIRIVRLEDND